jgi:hypothetical protein
MKNLLASAALFFLSLPVLAAMEEGKGANAPVETVDMVYVVIFCVIFIGAIVAFFIYYFWQDDSEDKPKQE